MGGTGDSQTESFRFYEVTERDRNRLGLSSTRINWGSMAKQTKTFVPGTLAVRVQSVEERQIEERQSLNRARDADERARLEALCVPAGDMGARITGKVESRYSVSRAIELTACAVVRLDAGLSDDEAGASPDWDQVRQSHLDVMRAMLILRKIVAHDASGARVSLGVWHPGPITDLMIARSSFEKFASVLGIAFEETAPKDLRRDQKENLLDIIGALHQLLTTSSEPRAARNIAGLVQRMIKNRNERFASDKFRRNADDVSRRNISDKTVRDYLTDARERGFDTATGNPDADVSTGNV